MATGVAPPDERAVSPQRVLHLGLGVTVLAGLLPLLDVWTLDSMGDHVRSAYPHWSEAQVAQDRNAIAGYLAGVGALGAAGWAWAAWLVRARRRARRAVTCTLFCLGALVALFDLSFAGDAYDRVIPLAYGLLGLVPVVVGGVAVKAVLRQDR